MVSSGQETSSRTEVRTLRNMATDRYKRRGRHGRIGGAVEEEKTHTWELPNKLNSSSSRRSSNSSGSSSDSSSSSNGGGVVRGRRLYLYCLLSGLVIASIKVHHPCCLAPSSAQL